MGTEGTLRLVLLDAAAWLSVSVAVGFAASRIPAARFARDGRLTRIRPFERGGRRWEAVGVRRWKDALPEAGGLFGGSAGSKSHLASRSDVERLRIETRRAECVHWAIAAAGPLFALWNPPAWALAMILFGPAFNAPFIVVQRYNRARLGRVAARARPRPIAAGGC